MLHLPTLWCCECERTRPFRVQAYYGAEVTRKLPVRKGKKYLPYKQQTFNSSLRSKKKQKINKREKKKIYIFGFENLKKNRNRVNNFLKEIKCDSFVFIIIIITKNLGLYTNTKRVRETSISFTVCETRKPVKIYNLKKNSVKTLLASFFFQIVFV